MSGGGQSEEEAHMLSMLPHELLQAIIQRLSLRDVWSLWQTSRAVQTAVRNRKWDGVVQLGRAWADLGGGAFRSGILGARMFAPGRIRRMRLARISLMASGKLGDENLANQATDVFAAHVPHVQFLELDCRLTSLTPLWPRLSTTTAASASSPSPSPSSSSCANDPTIGLIAAHFSSLRELIFFPGWATAEEVAELSRLTTLTRLTLRKGVDEDTVNVAVQLSSLRELVLDSISDLRLSEGFVTSATSLQRLELRRCQWVGPIPGWLANLSAARCMELRGEEFDISTVARLPALESLQVQVKSLTVNPVPDDSASVSVARVRAQRLTSLDLGVQGEGVFDLDIFPALQELRVRCSVGFAAEGSLSSMPQLVSLEVCGAISKEHLLESSDLAHLQNLRFAKISLAAFRRPLDMGALLHVPSVAIVGRMSEYEELALGRLSQTSTAIIKSLTCNTINPTCVLPQLTSFTSLRAPRNCTLGANFSRLHTLSLTMWFQQLRTPIVLPQLKTLELMHAIRVEAVWGRMLPNLTRLSLLDGRLRELPVLERGSWPRLMVVEVKLKDLSGILHTWFTLPSLRRFAITKCHNLRHLPEVPDVVAGDCTPKWELAISGCQSLSGLPGTLVRLRRLSHVTIRGCTQICVPSCLDVSGIKVVRWP